MAHSSQLGFQETMSSNANSHHCLLLGATGFLGRSVALELASRDILFAGSSRREAVESASADVRFEFPVDRLSKVAGLNHATNLIIATRIADPRGLPDQDDCAFRSAMEQLCEDFMEGGADGRESRVTYISSDAVFSGSHGPYVEFDVPDADTAYGRRQRIAEETVQRVCNNALIIRTSYVFNKREPASDRRFRAAFSKVNAGQTVRADDNVFKSPISVDKLARFVVANAISDRTGILHANADRMSVKEFYSLGFDLMGIPHQKQRLISNEKAAYSDTSLLSRFK